MNNINRTTVIKSHITAKGKAILLERSKRMRMTMSDYIRRVMINFKLPDAVMDTQVISQVLHVNASLARLGNLLKLTLDQTEIDEAKINLLLLDITKTKAALKKHILAINL